MKLLTKREKALLPPIGAQDGKGDDAIAFVKWFDPTSHWTWYATEFDGEDLCFGLIVGDYVRPGYWSLRELQSVRGRFGLGIERDMFFTPTTLKEIRRMYNG